MRYETNAADKAVLVLEAIADRRLRPASLRIVALIFEACSVDVGDGVKRECVSGAVLVVNGVNIAAMQNVLEAGEAMLPARRFGDRQFQTGKKIVLVCS